MGVCCPFCRKSIHDGPDEVILVGAVRVWRARGLKSMENIVNQASRAALYAFLTCQSPTPITTDQFGAANHAYI